MITQMKKYTFMVFHRDYNNFLERLRELGVLHINTTGEGVSEDAGLQEKLALADKLGKTIAAVTVYLPSGAHSQQSAKLDKEQLANLFDEFTRLLQDKQQLEQAVAYAGREMERMQVWGDFSHEKIASLEREGHKMHFFVCPADKMREEWKAMYNAVVVAEEKKQCYFVTVTSPEIVVEIDAEEVTLNDHNATQLQADIDGLKGLLATKEAQLNMWAIMHLADLQAAERATRSAIDWQKVTLSTTAAADDKLYLLEGFCPIDKVPELDKMLDAERIYYSSEDPTEEDEAPVKLHNNRFAKLFEVFTGMYGWPVYGEFDPTPILAPFYLLFFAMCMGDAGYGILLILFGILTSKKVLNIEMFEGLGPIITTLGVGTLVVGFFLGTAFGMDLSALFPGIDYLFLNGKVVTEGGVHYLSKAAYAATGMEGGYDVAMVLSILIGVFHICLAMVVKALCYTKRFGFRAQLSTWGWTLLIVGGIATLIICLALAVPMEVTKIILISIAAVSALGIYVFNTPGRNPLINIGAGLWDTYNMATGILGDVLSYIRLYALGLAGGMLGGAFNNLGLMVMGGSTEGATWQWVPFVIILIVGHLLNLAMSALGAFVHPLRLTFVEYFKNSGYEGKGNLYSPFMLKEK
ncbi:MAG: ATPase V [Paludibacteraceae bacterium]|nr:ATPase V [Paludibacteraceae bacterium]